VRGKILGGGADEDSLSIWMWGVWVSGWESSIGSRDANSVLGG
jgi:hypothetical protein